MFVSNQSKYFFKHNMNKIHTIVRKKQMWVARLQLRTMQPWGIVDF